MLIDLLEGWIENLLATVVVVVTSTSTVIGT
jgi:hypothetical protein